MEILLQKLQEQREAMTEHQWCGDGGENLFPPRKYVSVFRINGEPIIPPLMTSEKRREMLKLKEKAIKIEQRLKQRQLRKVNDLSLDLSSDTSRSSEYNTEGDISQRTRENYDTNQKKSDDSIMLLEAILRQHSGPETEFSNPKVKDAKDKLKKLQKSETLIYDNSTNEVIKQKQDKVKPFSPLPEFDQNPITTSYGNATKDDEIDENMPSISDQMSKISLRELERRANLNYIHPKKPSQLLLAGINDFCGIKIPTICLNPPTPLVGAPPIYAEALSGDESNEEESQIVSPPQRRQQQPNQQEPNNEENLSSDESFSSMYTHCESSAKGIPRSNKIHNLKEAYNSPSNVISKIQQFEAICSDHSPRSNTSKTPEEHNNLETQGDQSSNNTSPNTSPKKTYDTRTNLSGPSTFSRSATSPSIKLSPSPIRSQTSPDHSDSSPDNSLVRSSSFTLEAPSKALMDHLREKHTQRNATNPNMSIQPIPPMRATSAPSRVHRDTVESKAKRVQKVELKPLREKMQQKVAQNKLNQSSSNNYPTSFPGNSTINLYKNKRSPYDSSSSIRSVKNSSGNHLRKSPSNSSQTVPNPKPSNSKPKQTNSINPQKPQTPDVDPINLMDKMQKEKFQRLLKHQEKEQRLLKHTFEMQQKMLLDQLQRDMATGKSHEPPKQTHLTNVSQKQDATFTSDPQENSQRQDKEYCQEMPHNSHKVRNPPNTMDLSSVHSPVPSLHLSQLPSDSNANSSLDTTFRSAEGNVSNQTTSAATQRMNGLQSMPSTETLTPTSIENGYDDGGFIGSGRPLSSSSTSSRRRLFMQNNLPCQFIATQPQVVVYNVTPPNPRMSENYHHQQNQQQPLQQPSQSSAKKVPVVLGNNTSNRRT